MAKRFDVAVMHDFYIDRLVFSGSVKGLTKVVEDKAAGGGGGVHGVRQEDARGGNAVNLAHALARLGLRTLVITHSDRMHEGVLRQTFEGLDVDLRVKPRPTALTVAFEGDVNVMLGDGRGASDFGPRLLDRRDWLALGASRVVCSVNWAINRRGTELLLALRRRLGEDKPIFFDPADFRDRGSEAEELMHALADRHLVDWVSMNEHEGMAAAETLGVPTNDLGEMCKGLAKKLSVVFDLHAVRASYTSEGTRVSKVPVNTVRARRLTGAGDVWDAGAIYGRLKGMEEVKRLEFANGAARFFLLSKELEPPTLAEVRRGRD
jgi:sugar/nucleoside kinase (ribokinase family)